MKIWKMSSLVAMLAVAGLVACGGGDGGTTTTDEGGTPDAVVTTDTTPEPDGTVTTDTPVTPDTTVTDTPVTPDTTVTDTPVTPDTTVTPDVPVCVPECTDKECGPDGCNGVGVCGTCDEAAGKFCDDAGKCIVPTCEVPTAWGPAGVIDSLETPSDATVCPDFSGDGKGDNGLKGLAGTINPEIKKALEGGDIGIIFEFKDVADFTTTASFDLNGLLGEPEAAGSTNYLIDEMSYKPADCKPLIAFPGAKIEGGVLAAGPSKFILAIPIPDVGTISFTLNDTQVKANLTGSADGVSATDGVLAGVLTKAEVDAVLATLEAQCAAPNPPSLCSYLSLAKNFLPMLFDLDQDKDGTKDAASVCMKYTLAAGKVTGYKVAD